MLLARHDEPTVLWVQLVLLPLLLCKQFQDELIVSVSELLVHTGHHSNVVIVYQIYFLEV